MGPFTKFACYWGSGLDLGLFLARFGLSGLDLPFGHFLAPFVGSVPGFDRYRWIWPISNQYCDHHGHLAS